MDNDDNNSNENNIDQIKEASYSSANNNYYKSKDSSSSSLFVNKIKCNNINVNLNGVDSNIGLPFNNGPVTGPITEVQALDGEGTDSFVSTGENRQPYSGTDSRIACINNNVNQVGEIPSCEVTVDAINIGILSGPNGIAYDPINERMYTANFSGDNVSVIDRDQ